MRHCYLYRPGHPLANERGFVDAAQVTAEEAHEAQHAPILAGRFYENTVAQDGTDIGSRAKRKAYMRAHNLADSDDFKGVWAKAAEERCKPLRDPSRRDDVGRAFYEQEKRR